MVTFRLTRIGSFVGEVLPKGSRFDYLEIDPAFLLYYLFTEFVLTLTWISSPDSANRCVQTFVWAPYHETN